MSTSGTTTWQLNRNSVINAALRKIGALSGGGAPEAYEITNAAEALNAMIKSFQADGMPLWAVKEYTFTTQVGVNTYDIGVGKTFNTSMPLKVTSAYRVEQPGSTNVPLQIKTHYDFNLLPTYTTSGEPVSLFYEPLNTYGTIHLWPSPIDATTTITLVYQRPFEDMNISTDDFDFPSYWTEALIYGLAWRLAPEYGIPINDKMSMAKDAEFFHNYALSFGTEEGSLYFQPDRLG